MSPPLSTTAPLLMDQLVARVKPALLFTTLVTVRFCLTLCFGLILVTDIADPVLNIPDVYENTRMYRLVPQTGGVLHP